VGTLASPQRRQVKKKGREKRGGKRSRLGGAGTLASPMGGGVRLIWKAMIPKVKAIEGELNRNPLDNEV